MIERYFIDLGMRCGTVKNFNNTVLDDARKKDFQHWYFLTPINSVSKVGNLKECVINLAFPFIATKDDATEADIYKRLSLEFKQKGDYLVNYLRKDGRIRAVAADFKPVAFWANNKIDERDSRKTFAQIDIHILSGKLTVLYRDSDF